MIANITGPDLIRKILDHVQKRAPPRLGDRLVPHARTGRGFISNRIVKSTKGPRGPFVFLVEPAGTRGKLIILGIPAAIASSCGAPGLASPRAPCMALAARLCRAMLATPRPYRTRIQFQPLLQMKKGPRWDPFFIWWRRRELNPRPLVLRPWLYMLSFRLLI